jgi:hypothetical protein
MMLHRQGAYVTSRQPTGKRQPICYAVAEIVSSDLSLRKSERTLDLHRPTPSPACCSYAGGSKAKGRGWGNCARRDIVMHSDVHQRMNANGFLHHMIYSPETGIILVLTLSTIIQTHF